MVCPPLRALLVNLKHHPYQAYWFLHWSHRTSFQDTYARPLAKCQGLFVSLERLLSGTISNVTYYVEIVKASKVVKLHSHGLNLCCNASMFIIAGKIIRAFKAYHISKNVLLICVQILTENGRL